MLTSCVTGTRKMVVPLAALLLAVGCAQDRTAEPTTSPVPAAPSTTAVSAAPLPTATPEFPQTMPSPSPSLEPSPTVPAQPALIEPCSDDDLDVAAGRVESTDTLRRTVVSFTNSSARACALTGYPAADLVTAAGGVLVQVQRRPANAAPRLELQPGEVATADVAASAVDTATGGSCGRIGTLTVTPPDNDEPRLLEITLPICDATISAVG